MAKTFVLVVATVLCSVPALAQSGRVYVAGTLAADSGSRGHVDVGTLGTVGGILGVRLSDAWSVEFHADRGNGSRSSTSEGLWSSAASPGASREESERQGVFARHDRLRRAPYGCPPDVGLLVPRNSGSSHDSRAGHPGRLRCSSFEYSRYSQSSRLAGRAPRSGTYATIHCYGTLENGSSNQTGAPPRTPARRSRGSRRPAPLLAGARRARRRYAAAARRTRFTLRAA
jgi:hypothetical protein